jgi:hypothetical protein
MEGFTDGSMFIYRKSWREEGIVGVSREGELIAFLSGPLWPSPLENECRLIGSVTEVKIRRRDRSGIRSTSSSGNMF